MDIQVMLLDMGAWAGAPLEELRAAAWEALPHMVQSEAQRLRREREAKQGAPSEGYQGAAATAVPGPPASRATAMQIPQQQDASRATVLQGPQKQDAATPERLGSGMAGQQAGERTILGLLRTTAGPASAPGPVWLQTLHQPAAAAGAAPWQLQQHSSHQQALEEPPAGSHQAHAPGQRLCGSLAQLPQTVHHQQLLTPVLSPHPSNSHSQDDTVGQPQASPAAPSLQRKGPGNDSGQHTDAHDPSPQPSQVLPVLPQVEAGVEVAEYVLGDVGQPDEIGRQLFGALRMMDSLGVAAIVVEGTVEDGAGAAVMNRLRKAATNVLMLPRPAAGRQGSS